VPKHQTRHETLSGAEGGAAGGTSRKGFYPFDPDEEYKEIANLDADMQMFTEMLVRNGNLKQMQ